MRAAYNAARPSDRVDESAGYRGAQHNCGELRPPGVTRTRDDGQGIDQGMANAEKVLPERPVGRGECRISQMGDVNCLRSSSGCERRKAGSGWRLGVWRTWDARFSGVTPYNGTFRSGGGADG